MTALTTALVGAWLVVWVAAAGWLLYRRRARNRAIATARRAAIAARRRRGNCPAGVVPCFLCPPDGAEEKL